MSIAEDQNDVKDWILDARYEATAERDEIAGFEEIVDHLPQDEYYDWTEGTAGSRDSRSEDEPVTDEGVIRRGKLRLPQSVQDITGILQGGHGFEIETLHETQEPYSGDAACPVCGVARYDKELLRLEFPCVAGDVGYGKNIPDGWWHKRKDMATHKKISNNDPRWGSYPGEQQMKRESGAGMSGASAHEIVGWSVDKCSCGGCTDFYAFLKHPRGLKATCGKESCRKELARRKRAEKKAAKQAGV